MSVVAEVFVLKVAPSPGSPYLGKIGSAVAEIWITGKPKEECEAVARAYVMEHSWLVELVQQKLEISEADIHRYRPDAQASFRAAKERGISAVFVTSPPVDREDNIVEIHHMEPPLRSPDSIQ
jgi:hypothetical protein